MSQVRRGHAGPAATTQQSLSSHTPATPSHWLKYFANRPLAPFRPAVTPKPVPLHFSAPSLSGLACSCISSDSSGRVALLLFANKFSPPPTPPPPQSHLFPQQRDDVLPQLTVPQPTRWDCPPPPSSPFPRPSPLFATPRPAPPSAHLECQCERRNAQVFLQLQSAGIHHNFPAECALTRLVHWQESLGCRVGEG
jgi:hypothetical protein